MSLENQDISDGGKATYIKKMTDELVRTRSKKIWEI